MHYTLSFYNGGIEDDEITGEQVSSGYVDINGERIVGNNNLNQNVSTFSEPVSLQSLNEIEVEVRGKPGGVFTIVVVGIDDVPPIITASMDVAPNAAGWHATNVIVSFECSDQTSGIKTCPGPITISNEGAGQVVSGTACGQGG